MKWEHQNNRNKYGLAWDWCPWSFYHRRQRYSLLTVRTTDWRSTSAEEVPLQAQKHLHVMHMSEALSGTTVTLTRASCHDDSGGIGSRGHYALARREIRELQSRSTYCTSSIRHASHLPGRLTGVHTSDAPYKTVGCRSILSCRDGSFCPPRMYDLQ